MYVYIYIYIHIYIYNMYIQYNTIRYNTIQYNTIHYTTLPYHTIPYHTIPYHTIPYHTIQYNTIQYNTSHTEIDTYIPLSIYLSIYLYIYIYIHMSLWGVRLWVCFLVLQMDTHGVFTVLAPDPPPPPAACLWRYRLVSFRDPQFSPGSGEGCHLLGQTSLDSPSIWSMHSEHPCLRQCCSHHN